MVFLSCFTYAARYSAFNPIEHAWAPLTPKLSGIILPSVLEGERKPPAKQSGLTTEQLAEKEKRLFDGALKEVAGHWQGMYFAEHDVTVHVVNCGEDELTFDDYERVKAFLKIALRDAHQYADLRKEFMEMFSHIDRHLNEIVFIRCNVRRCCNEFRSGELKSYFVERAQMRLMAPTPSIQYKGHYKSFFEEFDNEYPMVSDVGQPSAAKNDLGVCDKCPSYRFTSKTEKKRHDGLFHRRQKTTPMSATEKHFECKFSNCGELFGSQPSLSRHQLLSKHRKRDQQAVNPNLRFNRPTSKKTEETEKNCIGSHPFQSGAI